MVCGKMKPDRGKLLGIPRPGRIQLICCLSSRPGPVTIYRLICKGTIEEKIIDLHTRKRDLAESLLEGTDRSHTLTAEEMFALLRD